MPSNSDRRKRAAGRTVQLEDAVDSEETFEIFSGKNEAKLAKPYG